MVDIWDSNSNNLWNVFLIPPYFLGHCYPYTPTNEQNILWWQSDKQTINTSIKIENEKESIYRGNIPSRQWGRYHKTILSHNKECFFYNVGGNHHTLFYIPWICCDFNLYLACIAILKTNCICSHWILNKDWMGLLHFFTVGCLFHKARQPNLS